MATDCFVVNPGNGLNGTTTVPGDKSMSHRAVMFGALAQGVTHVRKWLPAGDTLASLGAIRALGVEIEREGEGELTIHGGQLHEPQDTLDLVNAGTGIRLLTGIMVGQPFPSVLDGSEQLRHRPMNRIINPLRQMGAEISGVNGCAPLTVKPATLHGIHYDMPVASAQVKSSLLLAALFAQGPTVITQPGPARDHTERMMQAMGVDLVMQGNTVTLVPGNPLKPMDFTIPGDASSAAFPVVAALIVPGSDITLTNVNLNRTRTGIFEVLQAMGADLTITETGTEAGDPVGTIRAKYSQLKGVTVGGEVVVRMIDEFPIFMVATLFAEGETVVRDAEELRVKETDRLAVMTAELVKFGAQITETKDGFSVKGVQTLTGTTVDGHDDHRLSMSLVVAGLAAQGETTVLDAECAADSFPGYAETMVALGADVVVRDLRVEA
ncbi:MAG TPA: 3-phosphoshikimate 1-carboxyvinyltransferase [Phototrophicaceae bacterium]|nr:3-phosphoshikimate 1-carboxyvinyltransferase [Phototrophicaceae bacterium]